MAEMTMSEKVIFHEVNFSREWSLNMCLCRNLRFAEIWSRFAEICRVCRDLLRFGQNLVEICQDLVEICRNLPGLFTQKLPMRMQFAFGRCGTSGISQTLPKQRLFALHLTLPCKVKDDALSRILFGINPSSV